MDSSVYKEEIKALKFRQVDDSLVLLAAKSTFSDQQIRKLSSGSSIPLYETIRVLTECTPIGEINADKLAIVLESNNILQSVVKQNPALVTYYKGQVKEDRALPILAVEEIVTIIVTAFMNGAFSEIAKHLLEKLLTGAPAHKKDIKKALHLLLSNSLLPLLEENENGQTANQIAKRLSMKPEEAGYFLAKYEEQGWIKQVEQGKRIVWKLKKSREKIIAELIP